MHFYVCNFLSHSALFKLTARRNPSKIFPCSSYVMLFVGKNNFTFSCNYRTNYFLIIISCSFSQFWDECLLKYSATCDRYLVQSPKQKYKKEKQKQWNCYLYVPLLLFTRMCVRRKKLLLIHFLSTKSKCFNLLLEKYFCGRHGITKFL